MGRIDPRRVLRARDLRLQNDTQGHPLPEVRNRRNGHAGRVVR